MDHLKFKEGESPIEFLTTARIVKNVFKKFLGDEFPCDVVNINVPDNATENTPVEITKLAKRMYSMHVEERIDPRSRSYYWLDGYPVMDEEDGTDVYAVRNKRNVSVTPLTLDNTAKNLDEFKEKYAKKF